MEGHPRSGPTGLLWVPSPPPPPKLAALWVTPLAPRPGFGPPSRQVCAPRGCPLVVLWGGGLGLGG